MKKQNFFLILFLLLSFCLLPAAYATEAQSPGYAIRGTSKVVHGVIAIPQSMIEDSGRFMFPLGIVTGAVRGSIRTVGSTISGAFDLARAAAPYAKYLIFL